MLKYIIRTLAMCLLAAPLMFILSTIDPVHAKPGLGSYVISFLSLLGAYLILTLTSQKGRFDRLVAMRSDGLNEEKIVAIVGKEEYGKMVAAFDRFN